MLWGAPLSTRERAEGGQAKQVKFYIWKCFLFGAPRELISHLWVGSGNVVGEAEDFTFGKISAGNLSIVKPPLLCAAIAVSCRCARRDRALGERCTREDEAGRLEGPADQRQETGGPSGEGETSPLVPTPAAFHFAREERSARGAVITSAAAFLLLPS